MTDLTPGSRWLLPVVIDEIDTHYVWVMTDAKGTSPTVIEHDDLTTLISADRITELEAEVARLRRSIAQIHDMLMAPSPLDEYMLRQLVLFTYLEKQNPNVATRRRVLGWEGSHHRIRNSIGLLCK